MKSLILIGVLGLAACSAAQTASTTTALTTAVADGQLVCKNAQGFFAIFEAAGPLTITGQAATVAATACAAINAIPQPAPPAGTPVVAATVNVPLTPAP